MLHKRHMTDEEILDKVFRDNDIEFIYYPKENPDKILVKCSDCEFWLDRDFNIFDTRHLDKE